MANVLPRHTVNATLLGKLLIRCLAEASIKAAAQTVRLPFPLETIYHLLQRLRRRLPEIRSRLCRRQKAPPSSRCDPLGHTIEHLELAFSQSLCSVSDFQLSFQQPLLG